MTKIRAELQGADFAAKHFLRAAAQLQGDLREAARDIGEEAELIYSSVSPKSTEGTPRLARGMSSEARGNLVLVRAHARDPESGYDYVGVTRFGHKLPRIHPTRVWGRSGPPYGAALRTPRGFFKSVPSYQPKGDWSRRAHPAILQTARRRVQKLGHDITVKLA